MSKISFNPKAQGSIRYDECGDVSRPMETGAFVPVVVHEAGMKAIMEGLRLANIEGFHMPRNSGPTEDIDPT